jgi:hypothetical protein
MREIDLEDELRRLLALPLEERAKYGRTFSELSAQFMMSMHKRLSGIAAFHLRRFHLRDHGEDVATNVVVKAHHKLNLQFLGKKVANPWCPDEPMLGWLLSTQGIPFTGLTSGLITNYIRSQRQQGHGAEPFEEGLVADSNPLAERFVDILLSEQALAKSKKSSAQIEAALAGYPVARDAFLFRIRKGVHSFDELNADTLVDLAKQSKLPLSMRKIIREIAGKIGCSGEKTIDPVTAGKCFGLSARQVLNIVKRVAGEIGYSTDDSA